MTEKINDLDKKYEEEMANLREHCDVQISAAVQGVEERMAGGDSVLSLRILWILISSPLRILWKLISSPLRLVPVGVTI